MRSSSLISSRTWICSFCELDNERVKATESGARE